MKAIVKEQTAAPVVSKRKSARGRTADGEPNPVDVYVGSRIRLRRILLGLSQERFAGLLGMTFQQVQKYETGRNRVGASRLWDIANVLKTDFNYFYQDMDEATKKASPRHQRLKDSQMTDSFDDEIKNLRDPLQDNNMIKMITAINKINNPEIMNALKGLLLSLHKV